MFVFYNCSPSTTEVGGPGSVSTEDLYQLNQYVQVSFTYMLSSFYKTVFYMFLKKISVYLISF